MNEFYEKAIEHLEEEIEDACEYLKEADEAKADGKPYLAEGMHKIAMDEYTHAEFLRHYLMTKRAYHTHEKHEHLEEHWHRLRERLGLEE